MMFHLKEASPRDSTAVDLLRTIMSESYYHVRKVEILALTKSDGEKNFFFLTLTTEEAILNNGLIYRSERLKVSIIKDKDIGSISELRINTTLVVNNLPQRESLTAITKVLKRLFGEENITGVSFGHQSNQEDGRQSGWCHIQCIHAVVYTE